MVCLLQELFYNVLILEQGIEEHLAYKLGHAAKLRIKCA